MRTLIAGNWKMNGSQAMAVAFAAELRRFMATGRQIRADMLICPPAPYLETAKRLLDGLPVALGAQDCHAKPAGAYTGDISAAMLADLGCQYVIVGHSERRTNHGESNAQVRAKAMAAHAAGLIPIICIGETEAERDSGQALAVTAAQLRESFPENVDGKGAVVAYEPVWAIGSGRVPSLDDVEGVHRHIRNQLLEFVSNGAMVPILYGGSVKPENAADLLGVPEVGGALIGGASLKAADFLAIAASQGAR